MRQEVRAMEKQVDIGFLSEGPHEAGISMTWLICDNGMTVDQGTATYSAGDGLIRWMGGRPPAEFEGLVRCAIEDAIINQSKRRA